VTASRKSRLARIGTSHFAGSVHYSLTTEDWRQIEKAYDHKLNPPARTAIVEAVKAYFRDERFERNAPFVRDVMELLDKIGNAAQILNRAVLDDPKSDAGGPAIQARLLIEDFLPQPPDTERDYCGTLHQHVTALILAVASAKRELQKSADTGLVEGDAWDTLVCALTEIVDEHGLPRGVSKGLDKTPRDSPFVQMVESIQSTFPPESRRHYGSYHATAQAISVARRKREEREGKSERSPR
jgi:hypothetical protein